ncbi:hypothetical protein GBAR_LOCUS26549, partial [Geodia barretti]
MFVFGGNVKKTAELRSPILPSIPSIPQGFALSTDVVFAKECAKVMWSLKHHTEQIERMFHLMHQAALCYRYFSFPNTQNISLCQLLQVYMRTSTLSCPVSAL